jgi:hypothetical protein
VGSRFADDISSLCAHSLVLELEHWQAKAGIEKEGHLS